MRKANWAGVAILVVASGLVLAQSDKPADKPADNPVAKPQAEKQDQKPAAEPKVERVTQFGLGRNKALPNSLVGRISSSTKLPDAEVAKVLDALGPSVRGLLGEGRTVEIANLGTFRVVRIPEHKDLVDGRPATIGGSNFVEFLATGRFADAANQPGVQPAESVPPFEYNPLPDQTKGLKTGPTRQPNSRSQ
jgi:nucleoid DNA-binding protein